MPQGFTFKHKKSRGTSQPLCSNLNLKSNNYEKQKYYPNPAFTQAVRGISFKVQRANL